MRYFYYDGDKIIAEREGSSWVVRYLLGLKPSGHVVSGQVRVYHADRLGSVRWVTDGSGNLVASYVYEGFGKIVGQSDGGGGPYQFCGLWGYRNDNDAGLLHVGARYYEVEAGRWVQKDKWLGSIVTSQSLNRYAYCMMNPAVLVDPAGTWWLLLVLTVALVLLEGCSNQQQNQSAPPQSGYCPHGNPPGDLCSQCGGIVKTCPHGMPSGQYCNQCQGTVPTDPTPVEPPKKLTSLSQSAISEFLL